MGSEPRDKLIAVDDMSISFGPFTLNRGDKTLWLDGSRVELGARASSILAALVERPGQLVSKADLFKRVWPDIFVDEANLRVQVANLRKSLGDHSADIVTVPGLGYQFTGHLAQQAKPLKANGPPLPRSADQLIGRTAEIASIIELMQSHRHITIVGPGGIGKTSLAIAAARMLEAEFADGICFVDLGLVNSPALVAEATAKALNVPVTTTDLYPILENHLRDKSLLLILDNCEHLVEATADLTERLLGELPNLHLLATSREVLRTNGEVVEELKPLETPLWTEGLSLEEALNFSAIQLFARNASQTSRTFTVTTKNAQIVAEICRRLDGIPLAIELAAALAGSLGVGDIQAGLDRRFSILTFGRRTALPRQRTLAATLGWSYELLSQNEKLVIARLCAFAGPFPLSAAVAVTSGDGITQTEAKILVISLAQKSLLAADQNQGHSTFNLLESTRAYVNEQELALDRRKGAARKHAEYHLHLLEELDDKIAPPNQERSVISRHADEIRAALDWAYSTEGEAKLAVRLTLAAEPLWLALSLTLTCIQRMYQALDVLDRDSPPDLVQKLRVMTALADADIFSGSMTDGRILLERALAIAEQLDDSAQQLRILRGLVYYCNVSRQFDGALDFATKFYGVAQSDPDPSVKYLADYFRGHTHLERGTINVAKVHFECFLREYRPQNTALFWFDKRTSAQIAIATIELDQGRPLHALALAEEALADAETDRPLPTLAYATIVGPCAISLLSENLPAARKYIGALENIGMQFDTWKSIAIAMQGMLARLEGDTASARRQLELAFANLKPTMNATLYPMLVSELADVRRLTGDLDGAEIAVALALDACGESGELRVTSRVLRAKAEIALARGDVEDLRSGEELLLRSIEIARDRGAVTNELASAVALATAWQLAGRIDEAKNLLGAAISRVADGHDLPPMRRASALLQSLSHFA